MSEADVKPQTRGDRFFHALHRINAVAIFGFIVFALVMTVLTQIRAREQGYGRFADDSSYGSDDSYVAHQIETADGQIIAYEADENIGRRAEPGNNVSLTNMTTGESVMIAPEGHSVINWQLLERGAENVPNLAVGYMAFIANAEQLEAGRFDLIVGTFPTLSRLTVAENILYGDAPTVHGDGSVALIIWAEDDRAEFVSIDLATGVIAERRAVPLPQISENQLSLRESQRIYPYARNPVHSGSDSAPAPASAYGFVQW